MHFEATATTAGPGNKRIEWPIYVLKGNGSLDVLSAGIDTARYKLSSGLLKKVTNLPLNILWLNFLLLLDQ